MKQSEQLAAFISHIEQLFGVHVAHVTPDSFSALTCRLPDVSICAHCPFSDADTARTHRYGMKEAMRWNNRYIYYCPMGLAFLALTRQSAQFELTDGVLIGPLCMGDPQDLILDTEQRTFLEQLSALPVFAPAKVHSLSELSAAAFDRMMELPPADVRNSDQNAFQNLLESMQKNNSAIDRESYQSLLDTENALNEMVRALDKKGAQRLLNELLGKLYLQNAYDLEPVKIRSIELIVVLSRTVIDAGADVGQIFHHSAEYLQRINEIDSIEALYAWMSSILHAFIDELFSFAGIKHADTVYKTMEYIRTNCLQKLTLDDIAKHVYMSKAYLSMLFKQETGRGISEYLTQMRIEKGKSLLRSTNRSIADIANECCFHDQSYFTKVFQRVVGMSPKKYRSLR